MSNDVRGDYVTAREGAECLFPETVVQASVARVARSLSADLEGSDPLILCVMVGGFRFTSDLLGYLDFPLEVDYLQVSRYRDSVRGGDLDWRRYPSVSLRGRAVLVVDDVLDEGVTLATVLEHCREVGASSVSSAVLVDKQIGGRALAADYAALTAPNRYLFGEGMDYKGYGRNLRGIWALADGDGGSGSGNGSGT